MNIDNIFKKSGTTITLCPQCSLYAITNITGRPCTLCPYCGYSSHVNGNGLATVPGNGITVFQHNNRATFYRPGTDDPEIKAILSSRENTVIPPHYSTIWNQQNERPVLISGSVHTPVTPHLWQPIPTTSHIEKEGKKILRTTIYRGHDEHSAYIYNSLIYAHRANEQWDVYPEGSIKTTHIPYCRPPLQTTSTNSPKWQEMISIYRRQENIDLRDDE